jgi:LPXTG-site transpeptidase (sortase) family protein
LPGGGENIVMFGHDFTVFTRLGEVELGDVIKVAYNGTTYKYLITNISIVPNTNLSYEERVRIGKLLGAQNRELVTLITCHGVGSPDRLVVIGERIYETD